MRHRAVRGLALCVCILAGCAGWIIGCEDDEPIPPASDDYVVYDQLLAELPLGSLRPVEAPYVIEAETKYDYDMRHPSNVAYLKGHFPDITSLVDSITINIKPIRLEPKLFDADVIVIEQDELLQIMRTSPTWDEFNRRYPGSRAAFAVSRVAFNAERTMALVYWQYLCGGLCGAGSITHLNLVDGDWVIVKTLGLWVS